MLYDGIAAESAHVSIDGRATASIIDEKKLPEWAASEAAFSQVFQLGEAARKFTHVMAALPRHVLLRFEVGSGGG